MPDDLTDEQTDAIAEGVADDVTERILREHPRSSPEFRKLLVELYIRQATASENPAGLRNSGKLAAYLGVPAQRLSEDLQRALIKARRAYQQRYPEDL